MTTTPFTLAAYTRAIVHLDADAFFASVEQALVPALRGKPLVTGSERGIVACANYAAKAAGVKRGVPLGMAKQLCPGLIVVPSDYEAYSLFSKRIFNIMRQFTPIVEEYSIDEGFADITGLRRVFHASYEDIAHRMQDAIRQQLDISVSVGLSTSKSLAKLSSKFRKPNGFTAVQGRHIHLLLARTPLEAVWGFGPNTVNLLHKHGLRTALDYVSRPEAWAAKLLHKPGREIWHELRGHGMWPVNTEEKSTYATILKSKTFAPSSHDRELVFAQLIRNVEGAFQKARRFRLRPRMLAVILRHQDFHHDGLEARLNRPTACPVEVMPLIRHLFEQLFHANAEYRATMIILGQLAPDTGDQLDFFEDRLRLDKIRQVTQAVDKINAAFGKHTLASGSALHLQRKTAHRRDEAPTRHAQLLHGENALQRLGIPRLGIRV
ncbi:MAG: DNA polymerase IV [Verrucomicrobia bacterium]|nr:DNA polymerase IV [Verrucomicrobiota bacterium]